VQKWSVRIVNQDILSRISLCIDLFIDHGTKTKLHFQILRRNFSKNILKVKFFRTQIYIFNTYTHERHRPSYYICLITIGTVKSCDAHAAKIYHLPLLMEIFEFRLTKSVITTALCGVCFKGARTHMYAAWHKHLSRWQLSPIGLKELGHTHRHTHSPSASNSNCRPKEERRKSRCKGCRLLPLRQPQAQRHTIPIERNLLIGE
jgi:hypothetical protein